MNATKGNQFIADLMPKYPIYVNLLPKAAQETIGKPYIASEAAKAMLEREGFRYGGYLDIFDGGPTLEVMCNDIRTVKESRNGRIIAIAETLNPAAEKYMIGTQELSSFRAVAEPMEIRGNTGAIDDIVLTQRAAKMLSVGVGQQIRYAKA